MRSPALLAALLSLPTLCPAQQPLSFEPGGREACAKAVHMTVPAASENQRPFGFACSERDLEIEKAQFAALSKTIESRGPEERVAFNALMVSFAGFREARLKSELCRFGNGCTAILEDEKVHLNFNFLELAQQRVAPPKSTADDLTQADAELNRGYEEIFAAAPASCASTDARCISQTALRDTQRDWIRYRDAWLTFASVRFPKTTPESWQIYLTHERTLQIGYLFCQLSPVCRNEKQP